MSLLNDGNSLKEVTATKLKVTIISLKLYSLRLSINIIKQKQNTNIISIVNFGKFWNVKYFFTEPVYEKSEL